jgi:hypothetical protein
MNLLSKRWEYFITDAMAINGESTLGQSHFSKRREILISWIFQPHHIVHSNSNPLPTLTVHVKPIFEKRQIHSLFNSVQKEPGRYVFTGPPGEGVDDGNDGVSYAVEGVLIIPMKIPYRPLKSDSFLKVSY